MLEQLDRRVDRDGILRQESVGTTALDAGVGLGIGDGPGRHDIAAAGAHVDLAGDDVGLTKLQRIDGVGNDEVKVQAAGGGSDDSVSGGGLRVFGVEPVGVFEFVGLPVESVDVDDEAF